MTALLLDGKKLAQQKRHHLALRIKHFQERHGRAPGLALILVGNDPASEVYVHHKELACAEVGIRSNIHRFALNVSKTELLQAIIALNRDPTVDGILVQAPLPEQIDFAAIIETIDPKKDVDGFHPYNMGRLTQRIPGLRPCTPWGIIQLLSAYDVPFYGQHAVVVSASNIVGRPLALEFLLAGCTVTIAHRFTTDLAHHIGMADILAVAIGKSNVIDSRWIKPGAIVVDVGINRLASGKLVGDIDFASAQAVAAMITPVPGGVGPMTVTVLLENTLLAAETSAG